MITAAQIETVRRMSEHGPYGQRDAELIRFLRTEYGGDGLQLLTRARKAGRLSSHVQRPSEVARLSQAFAGFVHGVVAGFGAASGA